MAIICRDIGLLYIQVPGTGCSSVGHALMRDLGGEYLPREDLVEGGRKLVDRKHGTVPDLLRHDCIGEGDLQDLHVVANVRNPFDRFASTYERAAGEWTERAIENEDPGSWFNRAGPEVRASLVAEARGRVARARSMGFEGWLLRHIGCPANPVARFATRMVRRVRARGGSGRREVAYPMLTGVDEVIRFESLEEEVNGLLERLDAGRTVELPVHSATMGKRPYREYYSERLRRIVSAELRHELNEFGYAF